ncbi:hypothetical protein M0D45_13675 [Xanthomonas prunicola]|uniref:hypothetical protein n=1 Tax=Xanthomonas prunicola TaxID=2053930 RepID=UPI0021B1CCFB|nr:hypothetical protein [Xanthomonas prunicola]UXA55418.1 hypothetical protein M0D45_13675 [Xanthomonas prunicola]
MPITDMRPSQRWANASLQNQWLDALAQRNGDLFAMCHARNFINDEALFRGGSSPLIIQENYMKELL